MKDMTQEDKKLLLKDLSARLTYGVICQVDDGAAGLNDGKLVEIDISKELARFNADYYWDAYIDDIKLYLRPMSSMTEEEREEYINIKKGECNGCVLTGKGDPNTEFLLVDFFNAHHFDYRGLIEKDLALEASKGMYNIKEK